MAMEGSYQALPSRPPVVRRGTSRLPDTWRPVIGGLVTFVAAIALFCAGLYTAQFQKNGGLPALQQIRLNASSNVTTWVERFEGWPEPTATWSDFGLRRRRTTGYRHFIPQDKYPLAKCLDGTEAAIYVKESYSDKWFIFLEGWGYCYDLKDCFERSHTSHGSTDGEPHRMDLRTRGPYFSTDQWDNPLLHDFNWVFVRYCDGGYFSGDRMDPVPVNGSRHPGPNGTFTRRLHHIWFRGRHIREGVVDYLRTHLGMDKATDVILAGCSSGAITTLFSISIWHGLMPWVPRVSAFADSGYFLDLGDEYSAEKRFIIEGQNATGSLAPGCARIFSERPWACFVAANSLPFAGVPVFAWQSRYDSNQLLGGDCTRDSCSNDFGVDLTRSVQTVMAQQSYFIDGCFRHCSGSEPALNAQGVTPLKALQEWYSNVTVQIMQTGNYPCGECCAEDDFDNV